MTPESTMSSPDMAAGSNRSRPASGHGTQALDRALDILEILASNHGDGARLVDVAAGSGLHKATVHRLLSTLDARGFVQQNRRTKRYQLGLKLLLLGEHAAAHSPLLRLAELPCARLSRSTGDTVYLSVRQGFDSICVKRHEGEFPIRTLTLDVGSVRPLGVGAGSLALLSALPDAEIHDIVTEDQGRLATQYPDFSGAQLLDLVDETRHRGYSFNDQRVVPGMSAIGMPIVNDDGYPIASFSIAAISSRMGPERRADIAALLRTEAVSLAQRFSLRRS